ncbi:hypothetical protein MNV49_001104 [Pseudohyphozyma bogoriensis]|nr:hypothetical protein MNV49_001104 [Pseudohyphozyma bogoriensis]
MPTRGLYVLFGVLSWSTWLVSAQSCANGIAPTLQDGAYYCCSPSPVVPIDNTNTATGADSCSTVVVSDTNSIYQCTYATNTGLNSRTYQFPTSVTSLTLEVAGDNGGTQNGPNTTPGLTQIVTGALSDFSLFTNGLAYIFTVGSGGGFSSFGFNSAYATTDDAVQGPEDGRMIVAYDGSGGDAGNPAGADGVNGFIASDPDYGEGGTQTQGGVGHSGYEEGVQAGNGIGALGGHPTGDGYYEDYGNNPACPSSQRACPLPSGNFECLDYDELTSCGGCVSTGTGVDCLELPGVNGVSCIEGKCVALPAAYLLFFSIFSIALPPPTSARPMPRAPSSTQTASAASPVPTKKMTAIRKGFHRSRNGCLTCRKYHQKCDEQGSPDCLKCRQGMRECVWPEHVAAAKRNNPPTMTVQLPVSRPGADWSSSMSAISIMLDGTAGGDLTGSGVSPTLLHSPTDETLDPAFLDSLLGFTATNSPLLRQPLEPCELIYPDPGQRRLMRLFVSEAEKLMVNVSPQPQHVTFLDLSKILWHPEMGLSADALRLSLLAIGSLHEAWSAGRSDKAVLSRMLGVARNMGDAAAACLTTSMTLAEAGVGKAGLDETAFHAAAMLSVCQVLSGVNGTRKPFDMAFRLVDRWGGADKILESVKHSDKTGSIRKVLEFIAVIDVLDSLGSARRPKFLTSPGEASWWPRSASPRTYCELDTVETTFGVSRFAWRLFARVVDLVAQVKTGSLQPQYASITPAEEDFTTALLGMNPATAGDLWTYDSISQAGLLELELDSWDQSEDAKAALPRARHGNNVYVETARLLLARYVRKLPRTDAGVQKTTAAILSLLWDCHSRFGGVLYFMWPLLLAGAQADGELRATTLKILEAFSATYMFDCSASVLVLHQVWAQMDGGSEDVDVQVVVRELGYQFL